MTSKVEELLHKAKFRGVPFLFLSSVRDGGRKNVKHEYPNTNTRFVEDLGKVVPTFQIDAVITGKEDYIIKRDAFIRALEVYGPGELSHPFYGTMQVSVVGGFKVTETMKAIGRAEFSLEFAVTGPEIYPQQNAGGSSVIALKAEAVVQKIIASGEKKFNKIASTKKFGLSDVNSLINKYRHGYNVGLVSFSQATFRNALQKVLGSDAVTIADTFSSTITGFINKMGSNKNKIAASPSLFMSSIQTVFDNLESLNVAQPALYAGYTSMFNFRKDITFTRVNTIQRLANKENNDTITGVVNSMALVYAYKQCTGIPYQTSDEVLRVRNQLEDQYNFIISIPDIDYDVTNEIRELRTEVRQFFNTVESQVFRVTDIKTTTLPLPVLAYQYYGELSKLDQINNLNSIVEPSFVSGTVRILAP